MLSIPNGVAASFHAEGAGDRRPTRHFAFVGPGATFDADLVCECGFGAEWLFDRHDDRHFEHR